MTKPISRPVHSALDYAVPLVLVALPRLLGWRGPARRVLDAAAVAAVAYTVFTDHEGGLWRRIPMRGHLALDALHGTAVAAAGVALTSEETAMRATVAAIGAGELLVTALTDPGRA